MPIQASANSTVDINDVTLMSKYPLGADRAHVSTTSLPTWTYSARLTESGRRS